MMFFLTFLEMKILMTVIVITENGDDIYGYLGVFTMPCVNLKKSHMF